jgi:hypothetical protein
MKQKAIYILGYGFSGSTIFERILASSEDIIGLGELWKLKQDFEINEICACDLNAENCEFWAAAYNSYQENNKEIVGLVNQSLMRSNERYFVDSSKSSLKRLRHILRINRAYSGVWIHLYRNGKEVLHSTLKRNKNRNAAKQFFLAIKTSLNWNIANILAFIIRSISRKPSIAISYSSLREEPKTIAKNLSTFLNTKIEFNHQSLIPTTHQLTGNISRHHEITFNPQKPEIELNGVLLKLAYQVFGFPSSIIYS